MADTILVVVEQREGKLNRVSWETITAGQEIAAATGWTLEAAVVGGTASAFAAEVAAKKVAKVYAVESPKLEPYTPDAFAAALKQLITAKQPKLVLMPHTYQVRDFVPKLATAMGRALADRMAHPSSAFDMPLTPIVPIPMHAFWPVAVKAAILSGRVRDFFGI